MSLQLQSIEAHRPWDYRPHPQDYAEKEHRRKQREEAIREQHNNDRFEEPVRKVREAYAHRQWDTPEVARRIAREYGIGYQTLIDHAAFAEHTRRGESHCICWPDTSTPDEPALSLRKGVA